MNHNIDDRSKWSEFFLKNNIESFEEQRYKRLVESLDEYFCESPANYQAFMRDLQRGLNEIEEWPKEQLKAINEAKDCLRLHRLVFQQKPDILNGVKPLE